MDNSYPHIWQYYNRTSIDYGIGVRKKIFTYCKNKSLLIITTSNGKQRILNDSLLQYLESKTENIWIDNVKPNPSINDLNLQLSKINKEIDVVVGIGGGSVIDTAKAMSKYIGVPRAKAMDDLIFKNYTVDISMVPTIIAIPTTSGTGSEVTPFATVWDTVNNKKYSIAGEMIQPHYAIVDPELTYNLNIQLTLSTSLDALNQAFESIWNKNANKLTISLATTAIQLSLKAFKIWIDNLYKEKAQVRCLFSEASVLAGMAISQTRTSLCHSISYPLTAHFKIPHGISCGFSMLAVARINKMADPERFIEISKILGYTNYDELLNELKNVINSLKIQEYVRQIVPNLNSLYNLIPEMYTPERSGNCLFEINNDVMKKVLKESWGNN